MVATQRRRALLLAGAVFVLAVLARIGVQVALGFYRAPEVWEEGVVAANLAGGQGYAYYYDLLGSTHRAFRAPAYPFLLAGAYALFGIAPALAGTLNALLGGATALTTFLLGRRLGGTVVAALSGVLVATHPGLLAYATKVHQLSLDALLVTLAALLVVLSAERPRLAGGLALGAVAGALALSRPTVLPFVAIGAAVVAGRTWRDGPGRATAWALAFALVSVAITGGWVVRNEFEVGSPTLTTATGLTLWIGNNPSASGTTITIDGRPMLEAEPGVLRAVYGRDEVVQDRAFRDAALAYIAADPPRAVRAIATRLGFFWWFGPSSGTLYPRAWLQLYVAYYVVVVALAAVGAVALWRRGTRLALLVVLAALGTTALAQSLFYVDGRHRWGVEALLLVLASVGTVEVTKRIAPRLFPPAALAGSADRA